VTVLVIGPIVLPGFADWLTLEGVTPTAPAVAAMASKHATAARKDALKRGAFTCFIGSCSLSSD
jgi:hypothetical protein